METHPEKRNCTRAVMGRERTAPPQNMEDGREVYITDHWGLEARKDAHIPGGRNQCIHEKPGQGDKEMARIRATSSQGDPSLNPGSTDPAVAMKATKPCRTGKPVLPLKTP